VAFFVNRFVAANLNKSSSMKNPTLLLLALLASNFLLGQHTFSVVAVDPSTGEVGSAGATCLSSSDCGGCGGAIVISGIAPGRGAINAQASVCLPNSNLNFGLNQLLQGMSAPAALAAVLAVDPCNSGDTTNRQYGIVDLDSAMNARVASYTGSAALSYANHRTGATYSIQGNILLGPEVLDSLENAFNREQGPLCEKLMAAMLAARIPGADSRCLTNGTSSKSAFIRVAKPNDVLNSLWMDLNVPQVPSGMEPIDSLYSLFQAFKTLNSTAPGDKQEMLVFPNPGKGAVNVLLPYPAEAAAVVELYDASGRLFSYQPIPMGQRLLHLDTRNAEGILVLRYKDEKFQQTVRMLAE
jgi:uncharacterized Ntn-hydrolase superfamily protein